jgi:glutathione S-transferase
MSDQIVIYGFETSNNFKVRVGLGFKGIPYEFKTIEPTDRAEVVRISGQPFTPIMVHSDVVMFDSTAILRYLEANFPDAPRLFSDNYDIMREIEDWENFGRVDLHESLMILVRMRKAGVNDEAKTARSAQIFADTTAKLEEALTEREWLVDGRFTAADINGGAVVHRIWGLEPFPMPERPHTFAWAERVMAYDHGG